MLTLEVENFHYGKLLLLINLDLSWTHQERELAHHHHFWVDIRSLDLLRSSRFP